LYSDAGEFDRCCGINLEIRNQCLYHETDDIAIARLGSDSGVHSYGDSCKRSVNKIKLNVSNVMYHNYYHCPHISMVDILVNAERPLMQNLRYRP